MKLHELIATSKMSGFQIVTIIVAIVLTVLEGYDDVSVVFDAPYIEHSSPAFAAGAGMLGTVLSGSLIGMVVGSILVAPIADKIGRRYVAIIGTAVVAIGMIISPLTTNMNELLIGRIVTGLGLGALVSVVGVTAAEYSNKRVYPFVMAAYAAGINLGGVLGAVFVGPLLTPTNWQLAFWVGLVLSIIAFILSLTLFPESVQWLAARRKPGTLERLNRVLSRMGHDPLPKLPESQMPPRDRTGALHTVFSRKLAGPTILMMIGYILFLLVFYFANNWAPNVVAGGPHPDPTLAPPTTLMLGLGGIVGTVVFGLVTSRVNPRILTPIFLVIGAVGLAIFGYIAKGSAGPWTELFFTSFFFSAGVAGFYQIVPNLYPTLARATGYGIVVGAGRIGGIAAPILGGAALGTAPTPSTVGIVFLIFAIPLLLSGVTVVLLAVVEKAQRGRAIGDAGGDAGMVDALASPSN